MYIGGILGTILIIAVPVRLFRKSD